MAIGRGVGGLAIVAAVVLAACTDDEPGATGPDVATERPEISVTVPPERQTPFCQAMIDLTDQLRNGDVDDAAALIVETYRRIAPDAPNAIVDDFNLVLAALEAGRPPPTDPPRDTVATTPPSASTTTVVPSASSSSAPSGSLPSDGSASSTAPVVPVASGAVDEAFAPGDSPTERLNSYVAFECRSTANNPGPAPTQPGVAVDDTVS